MSITSYSPRCCRSTGMLIMRTTAFAAKTVPNIKHAIDVAELVSNKLGSTVDVCVALLCDAVNDKNVTHEDIKQLYCDVQPFDEDVWSLMQELADTHTLTGNSQRAKKIKVIAYICTLNEHCQTVNLEHKEIIQRYIMDMKFVLDIIQNDSCFDDSIFFPNNNIVKTIAELFIEKYNLAKTMYEVPEIRVGTTKDMAKWVDRAMKMYKTKNHVKHEWFIRSKFEKFFKANTGTILVPVLPNGEIVNFPKHVPLHKQHVDDFLDYIKSDTFNRNSINGYICSICSNRMYQDNIMSVISQMLPETIDCYKHNAITDANFNKMLLKFATDHSQTSPYYKYFLYGVYICLLNHYIFFYF